MGWVWWISDSFLQFFLDQFASSNITCPVQSCRESCMVHVRGFALYETRPPPHPTEKCSKKASMSPVREKELRCCSPRACGPGTAIGMVGTNKTAGSERGRGEIGGVTHGVWGRAGFVGGARWVKAVIQHLWNSCSARAQRHATFRMIMRCM